MAPLTWDNSSILSQVGTRNMQLITIDVSHIAVFFFVNLFDSFGVSKTHVLTIFFKKRRRRYHILNYLKILSTCKPFFMINEFRVTSLDESSFPLWCGGRAHRSVELQFNPENLCDRKKKILPTLHLTPWAARPWRRRSPAINSRQRLIRAQLLD